jgi:hypothetical protein
MKYSKPVINVTEQHYESIYAEGSGPKCRFNRTEYSKGVDACQSCSKTHGVSADEQAYREDFKDCIDGMPPKRD